ncbi:hypothetical protein [Arsenophonus nasoniae]|uniref:Uncharacterized protein n=1 Tax=Arsenophonus nasoniae TaxID=638 RepID=A0AA95GGA8_9GAMM|nr:hypothetical protein [Arsenophonus nasoniae]WGL96388.1 hypothetical protein QE207_07510 [Arsenophonus nasoniae]
MRLVYVIENIIKKYHDRPAIGERVKRCIKDAKSKRIVCQLTANIKQSLINNYGVELKVLLINGISTTNTH